MPGLATFVDAEAAVPVWANGVAGLTGPGNPITNGLHLTPRDSPARGTYGVVTLSGDAPIPGGIPADASHVTVSLWGPNKAAASTASVALANAFRALISPVTVTLPSTAQVRILLAANITRLWSPDGAHARYVVDVDLWIAPGP